MITTVTLNTSIDRLYTVDRLEDYTVMRVKDCVPAAGGKGLNVSRNVKLLGSPLVATGFVGGHAGGFIKEKLRQDGIAYDFCEFGGESRVCINVKELSTGRQTEFLEPGDELTGADVKSFLRKFASLLKATDVVTLSGSIPRGVPDDIYSTLIRMTKDEGKKVILDSSGRVLAESLLACPTVIKPNAEELGQILKVDIADRYSVINCAKQLYNGGIEYVLVTLGSDGMVMVCREGIFYARPPKVPVKNTVGCGDSTVAAVAVSLAEGLSAQEMLKKAVATSAANAMNARTGWFDRIDYDSIIDHVSIIKY